MLTQPSKISPEADFGNFSKSLQKERTAIFSEILSRIHPSTFQTEPRGEKHIFRVFSCKNPKSGVENPTFTNCFWGFGPRPGMFGVWTPTFTNYFWGFGPTPGMLGVENPFSEKMFQKHWLLHGLGAGVVHESGSTGSTGSSQSIGSTGNGPQLAVRTLGYSRLRPGWR